GGKKEEGETEGPEGRVAVGKDGGEKGEEAGAERRFLAKGEAGEKSLAKKKRRPAKEEVTVRKDIQLTWMGKPIFPGLGGLDEETVKLAEEIGAEEIIAKEIATEEQLPSAPKAERGPKTSGKKEETEEPKKRRRSPSSPSKKSTAVKEKTKTKRKVGRPKGSKNKKVVATIREENIRPPTEKDRGASLYLLNKYAESQIELSSGA
ncbi:hypothetical protein AOQ84DRAFT_414028, partial [Glonium stellatum]